MQQKHIMKRTTKFKLNKKYYLEDNINSTEGSNGDLRDFVIVREDKYTYYVVDSMSIDRCDDKDERGLIPLFEIEKYINGNSYNKEDVEQRIVNFLISIGVEL